MEAAPDLRDLESKVGRKTPESLLRRMSEEPRMRSRRRGSRSLEDKMEALRLELTPLILSLPQAGLRAIDVQILQQLLLVNEGIEAVKWLLEEKGAPTSRCSSLTSSQYSLAGSREASRRSSWNSLQDPAERLDSISIGSFLDTLADDMDEYSLSTSEPAVSSTLQRPPQTTTDDYITTAPRLSGGPSAAEEKPRLRPGRGERAEDAHWRWVQSQDDVTFL